MGVDLSSFDRHPTKFGGLDVIQVHREVRDLKYLWKTRHGSGFPWPTWRGFGGGWHMALTGYRWWVAVPLWKQVLLIPLRPWRYLKKVRNIAYTRAMPYHPTMEDEVP